MQFVYCYLGNWVIQELLIWLFCATDLVVLWSPTENVIHVGKVKRVIYSKKQYFNYCNDPV